MTITTRAGKTSALTHDELDANFTTLGLANGDTVANLNVAKVIINATETATDPRLVTSSSAYDGVQFERTSGSDGIRTTYVCMTDFTSSNITQGQGTGLWSRIKTTNGMVEAGGIYNKLESVTDSSNYTASVDFVATKKTAGVNDYFVPLTVSKDKVHVDSGAVYIQQLPTSDPTSANQLWNDNGTLKVSAG